MQFVIVSVGDSHKYNKYLTLRINPNLSLLTLPVAVRPGARCARTRATAFDLERPSERQVSRIRPAGRTAGCRAFFDGPWTALRKTPRDLRTRRGAPGATMGCPFFWFLFFGHAKKRNPRASAEAFAFSQNKRRCPTSETSTADSAHGLRHGGVRCAHRHPTESPPSCAP